METSCFASRLSRPSRRVENIYWDLVTAYEAVRVNERALQLAEKTLSDDQEQVRIGTLAPITLAQAKSGVATANQNLITSQTQLQLQQLLMKNAITKNMGDPMLAVAPVIPTDTLQINEPQEVRPVEDLIQEALQARPEIATARINLTNAEISRKSLKNALRPTLDVYAFYGASSWRAIRLRSFLLATSRERFRARIVWIRERFPDAATRMRFTISSTARGRTKASE